MKKIIIAVDSFKGSVSSAEAANAVAQGIHDVYPLCEVITIPVADGGEGTVRALVEATGGKHIRCNTHDPLMNPIEAEYGILADGRTAIIETAAASGLALIPDNKRNPMETTTFGTGELIKSALMHGCRHILVGLGGSATNDAGTGMLQALGYRFLDKQQRETGGSGKTLQHICHIDESRKNLLLEACTFTAVCDVTNPFFGEQGAARIFAPQKGASPKTVEQLDNGLRHFASLIREKKQKDIAGIPGSGAAGGMGGALMAFLNACLVPGIDVVLKAVDFENKLQGADLIITGEGRIDAQTCMGKVPSGILKASLPARVPVVAIAGQANDWDTLNRLGIQAVFPILPRPVSLEEAMNPQFTCMNIRQTVAQICRLIRIIKPDTASC